MRNLSAVAASGHRACEKIARGGRAESKGKSASVQTGEQHAQASRGLYSVALRGAASVAEWDKDDQLNDGKLA